MAHWLNKKIYLVIAGLLSAGFSFAQNDVSAGDDRIKMTEREYKDPDQFEKFRKRRIIVSNWQINELKKGALVVRLKTNKMLIDELLKQGNTKLAEERRLEQYAINKNTMFAFLDNFQFCKVYFIYSNSSDSLLNGTKRGIFLDTTLSVNPSIVMSESFYLLAERDYGYNSSIGFVPEDSAKRVIEKGNPVKQMAFLVKNKYGHQLKHPFPYYVKEKNFMDAAFDFPIQTARDPLTGQTYITFIINRTYLKDLKNNPKNATVTPKMGPAKNIVKVKKQFTYEKLAESVTELNDNLDRFYKDNATPDVTRIDQTIRPFLY
jgi:hypothetical protein